MWRQDVLEGVVRCVYTDGSVAEGQVVQGAWHCTVMCTVLYWWCRGCSTVLSNVLYNTVQVVQGAWHGPHRTWRPDGSLALYGRSADI